MHAFVCTHVHTYIHTYICTYIHYIHAYRHICIHTIHIYACNMPQGAMHTYAYNLHAREMMKAIWIILVVIDFNHSTGNKLIASKKNVISKIHGSIKHCVETLTQQHASQS